MKDENRELALEYHRTDPPGKLAIRATKPLANQHDLAMAYSPGVAAACEEIVADPVQAPLLTARGNLVAVITNGTAVLGLGAIGPLAAKPVMEGKAVLFKTFSGIDVFDLEIDERDPDKLVDIIASLEPTFGGINLEDIKAPECFIVEKKLRERMNIPVFHDDQHGTAIIVTAAVLNGLRVVGKNIEDVKLVASGAGAAALACLDLLVSIGLPRKNITVTDIAGVVYKGRVEVMDEYKSVYAQETTARTLAEVIDGADIFLGLSAGGVLKPEMLKNMAENPLIMALANPTPEILPEEAKAVRPDAIIATGRSDYPNQVNNVLCFPYIFKGALDVGATTINEEMKIACVTAIAELAMAEPSEIVAKAYGGGNLKFGPEYLIPKPFDPRLIIRIAPAVAKAAMDSGVATRPIADFKLYRQKLIHFVFQTGFLMKPLFEQAKQSLKRVIYAEGEESRVLQAMQQVVEEGIAFPVLVGRPEVIENRLNELSINLRVGTDFEIVNPTLDDRYYEYWNFYHELMGRKGVSPAQAKNIVRTQTTVIAALMLKKGQADAMLCGTVGSFSTHLRHVTHIIGKKTGVNDFSTVTALVLPSGTFFLCDTHVTPNPSAEEIVEMTLLTAETVKRFGIKPRIALLSHSNFGSRDSESAVKMREALALLQERDPQLVVEGEMNADAALSEEIRNQFLTGSRLKGKANTLIMPNIDAANIGYNLLRMLGGGVSVGPMLIGAANPAHILTSTVSVRGLVNMTALAAVEAQGREQAENIS
ncbi:MAG: malate dehydrogenase (oxaloacetate-decarboxylating)(NADP+) [Gammaproteobacteria bacterium]|jgi:malate dehydrogenase (oxaloacetate-decarboxylating)(NADP+)